MKRTVKAFKAVLAVGIGLAFAGGYHFLRHVGYANERSRTGTAKDGFSRRIRREFGARSGGRGQAALAEAGG
jgi:hypothetical protein